eukprot:TRINITY_DN1078_c0_g1_i7.p1 TRINITY_DN1078_c0_g1~~TRINITY_DN1078_c0_g1_i7.p1  ORF type:complete len:263 (+),score=14.79 TRINITY_DN1078_c0_g1_i7:191-979(+)
MWLNDPTRGLLDCRGALNKQEVGTNTFQFCLPYEGTWKLKITRGKKLLFGNEEITTQVSDRLPTHTINYEFQIETNPSNVRVGKSVSLSISIKENGKPVDPDPSQDFKVSVFGNGKRSYPSLTRNRIGEYVTEFSGWGAGYYVATVIYDKTKVVKRKIVYHEATSARMSSTKDLPTRSQRGQLSSFKVQAKDMLANPIGVGGDLWEFGISGGPATVNYVKIIDQQNGCYLFEYILPVSGVYNFRLLLDGNHVQGSPWRVSAT